jgi:hypothetical protein
MNMQETLIPIFEQIMKNTDAYLFVFTLSLARHIDHSRDSDIANDARTSHLPSSSDAGRAALQHVDHFRPSMDVIVCPHCASSFDHTSDSSYATFTQPREAL